MRPGSFACHNLLAEFFEGSNIFKDIEDAVKISSPSVSLILYSSSLFHLTTADAEISHLHFLCTSAPSHLTCTTFILILCPDRSRTDAVGKGSRDKDIHAIT